jgi:sulfate adenylyltransferase subunit 1
MKESLNVVVAGSLDSGKSTLIGRLLYDTHSIPKATIEETKKISKELEKDFEFAYLLDSFQEERVGEFTLDTTQALLKTKNKEYLLIDVPGHRALLKNMLTGTSYAETAILVVDVKKSLEEQTRRHLYILKFLGIAQIIVVINKMDLVSYSQEDFKKVEEQINLFLKEIGLKVNYVIPISAKQGENLLAESLKMNWYKGPTLVRALDTFTKKDKISYDFRFPVQDIYEIKQEKVAVGTVASGKVNKGDLIRVLPLDIELKVKAIKVFDKLKARAGAGESIGLVFDKTINLKRGEVVYKGKLPEVTRQIQAKIFCLSSLNIQEGLLIKCATQEASSRISQIKESVDTATLEIKERIGMLNPLEAAKVIINTEEPIIVEKFQDLTDLGRFVLQKNNEVCAVGIIG